MPKNIHLNYFCYFTLLIHLQKESFCKIIHNENDEVDEFYEKINGKAASFTESLKIIPTETRSKKTPSSIPSRKPTKSQIKVSPKSKPKKASTAAPSTIPTKIPSKKPSSHPILKKKTNPKPKPIVPTNIPTISPSKSSVETRHFNFTISTIIGSPDGEERSMLVVNGLYPGPTLSAYEGDRVIIKVTNALTVPSGIHWHGFRQIGTNDQDGAIGVTQLPIQPNETFIYNFLCDRPGTFWWHSHSGAQYSDGLRGAFIVKSLAGTDPHFGSLVLQEQTLLIADWYHEDSVIDLNDFLVPESEGNEPCPQTGVINGYGQTEECNEFNSNSPECKFTSIRVKNVIPCGDFDASGSITSLYSWDKYLSYANTMGLTITRFHTINGAGFAPYRLSIDDHFLFLLSEDSEPIVPTAVSSININVAQRYDFTICRVNNKTSNVWVRTELMESFIPDLSDLDANVTLAVLDYQYFLNNPYDTNDDNDSLSRIIWSDNSNLPNSGRTINTANKTLNTIVKSLNGQLATAWNIDPYHLVPLTSPYNILPPPAYTKEITLSIDFYENNAGVVVGHFNDTSFNVTGLISSVVKTGESMLEKVKRYSKQGLLNENSLNEINPYGYNILHNETNGGVLQLVINNRDSGEHPIHLHGNRFYVISRGYIEDGDFDPLTATINEVNPILRDTLTVNAGSYIVIRVADYNPGVWFLHCHIDWHLSSGLALVLVELPFN